MLHWKEMPDGISDHMIPLCGKNAESSYEGLEGVKGQLNAMASRALAHASGGCLLCF